MTTVYKWDKLKTRVNNREWARKTIESLCLEFEGIRDGWPGEPPVEPTDWTHHYNCPACGIHLLLELDQPTKHRCKECGGIYSGEPYDGAFRASVHAQIVLNLEYAAILAHLMPDPSVYTDYIRRYILFYTNNYTRLWFVHGKNAGQGRIMPQCLTEAIFIIQMEKILRMTRDMNLFSEEEMSMMRQSYFKPALDLMRDQSKIFRGGPIHNIQAWMISAIGACANALGDDTAWDEALNGERGWYAQLNKGTHADGLWYEISPGYHFYTLNALTAMAFMAKDQGADLFNDERLKNMVNVPFKLVYPDLYMPSYNDTGYNTGLASSASFFEPHLHKQPELGKYQMWLYDNDNGHPISHDNPLPTLLTSNVVKGRIGVNALLYGPDDLPSGESVNYPSRHLEASGIAILESKNLRVAMKFSPYGGGHDHNDKLAIDIFTAGKRFSPDLGTGAYALEITNKWHRSTIAHNMITVDGKKQQHCDADSSIFNDTMCSATATKAYPGVTLTRTLTLVENGFNESFKAESKDTHIYDWTFHGDGDLTVSIPMNDNVSDTLSAENGYDTLWNIKQAESAENVELSFNTEYGLITLIIKGSAGSRYFTARAHRQDGLHETNVVIIRREDAKTEFDVKYTFTLK